MEQLIYRERKNTNCTKWDGCEEKFGKEDLLAMWVADMDFEAPSCVKEALRAYVDFGVFGYYQPEQGYQDAFLHWEREYHGYEVQGEWLRFAPGVVPAVNWLLHILTREGDAVLIMPPVYYPFKEAILNNGRKAAESPLIRGEHGYSIDYEDFERKITEEKVKAFIFCSPHNPVGRVWKPEEIRRVLDICKRHQVYVISDEIHQDIVMSGHCHTPSALIGDYDDILVTLTAATKTFNLAACQNSIVILPDKELREKYDDYLGRLRIKGGNAFGYVAVQSAYEGGRPWLEELLKTVEGNYHYLRNALEKELPLVWISDLEGTYLMWIDLSAYIKPEEMEQVMCRECGIGVDYGSWFGEGESASCIRVNLATSRENIEEAAKRLIQALKK